MNIKSGQIFWRKWLDNLKVQTHSIRLVVDWTVALYIVVPALFIATFQYIEWVGMPPVWLESVPSFLFSVLLALIACSGQIRWFLDEADALFVLQREAWIKKIKLMGVLLSVLQQILKLGVLYVLLFPLIGHEALFHIVGFIFVAVYQLLLMAVKCYIHDFYGWKRIVMKVLTYAFGLSLFLTVVWGMHAERITDLQLTVLSGLLFFVAGLLLYRRAATKYYFTIDAEVDHHLKMKLPAMMLSQTISRKESKLRRPWLFRHSKRLVTPRTTENIYGEMAIKAFFRDSHKRKLFLGVIGVGSTAIILTPLIFKPITFVLLHVLLIPIISQHLNDLKTSDFSEALLNQQVSEELFFHGRTVLNRWIHVPAFAIFSAVFLLSLFFIGILRLLQV